MNKKSIGSICSLPKFLDERGNLSFLENDSHIPFEIKRVHWLYDVPGGETRGGLAYKETEEFIIVWRTIDDFSTNSVALIVASTLYDPADAIRDYQAFKQWRRL